MTPLALRFAKQLTLPVAKRQIYDQAGLLDLFGSDLHCFEITTIADNVNNAVDHPAHWEDANSMANGFFLPSPITWLEYKKGQGRLAFVIHEESPRKYKVSIAMEAGEDLYSIPMEYMYHAQPLHAGPRIRLESEKYEDIFKQENSVHDLIDTQLVRQETHKNKIESLRMIRDLSESRLKTLDNRIKVAEIIAQFAQDEDKQKKRIAFIMFAVELINTPGIIGIKQHQPHKAVSRMLAGKFPLRGWSEIVLKQQTVIYNGPEITSGPAFHKCLHFVRSHKRHYSSGKVSIIPAHWRGDPALGIKQTRYRVT